MVKKTAELSDMDQQLLAALRRQGRAGLSELSTLLGCSRATVRSHMQRLEAAGEIVGYTVQTRGDLAPWPVRAIMLIAIEGRGAGRIMARLAGLPLVQAVHSTNGKWDLIAELGAPSLEALDAVIFRIREIDGVTGSETNLLLSSQKALGSKAGGRL